MKAEINNENKAKFFALYWGQRIMSYRYLKEYQLSSPLSVWTENVVYLELKSLSQISDEDARVIAEQNRFNGNYDVFPKVGRDILRRVFELEDSQMCLPTESADYLRSKGYALPWMGLSVDEMVDGGWIKLTE
jgi:hypothetical protein